MKEKTKAALSWLDSQIAKAKGSPNMTTIKLSKNGRLSPDTIAESFRKAKFEVQFGKDDVIYVTPYGSTKSA